MYYEEKIIDGILHCKMTPGGSWFEVSKESLVSRLVKAETIVRELKELIEKMNSILEK